MRSVRYSRLHNIDNVPTDPLNIIIVSFVHDITVLCAVTTWRHHHISGLYGSWFGSTVRVKLSVASVRGDIGKHTADVFFHEVKFYKGEQVEAPPIFTVDHVHFVYLCQNGLYFVATTHSNVSGSFVAEVISRIARVFKDYCGVLTEEAIRQNFVMVYELLDEMIDFGYPQDTSTEHLRAYVYNEPVVVKKVEASVIPSNILSTFKLPEMNPKTIPSNAVDKPITLTGSSKKVNQIFVDIYERVNVIFNSDGVIIRCEIDGTIQMKSYLTGNPELKLALNEEIVIGNSPNGSNYGSIVLDDCNFHECVRTDDFETLRILRFIPPDGEFGVMNYRMTSDFRAPFRIFPFFEITNSFKCELVVKIRADIPENNYGANMVVSIPVPKTTSSASCEFDQNIPGQTSEYVPKDHKIVWNIPKFPGSRECVCRIKIVLGASHSDAVRKEVGPVSLEFEIPMYSVSNLQVRFLRIAEQHKNYNPYRWVRYVTRSDQNYEWAQFKIDTALYRPPEDGANRNESKIIKPSASGSELFSKMFDSAPVRSWHQHFGIEVDTDMC